MIYVCSDIHGCYDRFIRLLKRINFTDTDEMYVLGDVIDRNKGGIQILLYIMEHKKNIHLLMGNHEDFMYQYLYRKVKYQYYHDVDNYENDFDIWFADCNGGRVTYEAYKLLDTDTQQEVFKFLSTLPLIVLLEVNGQKYHLSHSATIPNVLERDTWTFNDLTKVERKRILWDSLYRYDGNMCYTDYPENYISIFGHVPVQRVCDNEKRYYIYKSKNIIDIDSGSAYRELEKDGVNTALSCYCLDTQKVVYVRDK